MDAYLNDYVNASTQEIITKDLANYLFVRTIKNEKKNRVSNFIKPFRGLGRLNPLLYIKTKKQLADMIKVKEPSAFRGLGKNTSYYKELNQAINESSAKSTKSFNYWRGLRTGA